MTRIEETIKDYVEAKNDVEKQFKARGIDTPSPVDGYNAMEHCLTSLAQAFMNKLVREVEDDKS